MPPSKRNTKRRRPTAADSRRRKKVCAFCRRDGEGPAIDYKDISTLRRYMSDRGKIRARRVTGNCGIHQRKISIAIKNAREMALLPYVSTRP